MTIVNRKNISTTGFGEDALATSTSNDQIINLGNLTTTGDLANGIFAAADDVTILNFAGIVTSGDGAAGIFAIGTDVRIDNFGSVTTHGGFFDPDPSTFGDEIFSEGILVFGDGFHIANYGTVHVDGLFSSAMAGVGADGVVVNYGRVECLSGSGVIAAVGDHSQAINAGQIVVANDGAQALLAIGDGASALNSGQIQMTGFGNAAVVGGTPNTHVTNAGTIHIIGDGGLGMVGGGSADQVDNFGSIDVDGVSGGGVLIGGIARANRDVVDNHGVITGHGDGTGGVILIGNHHHLTNSGQITTDGGSFPDSPLGPIRAAGVIVSGNDALLENTRTGVIESKNAQSAAVELNVMERPGLTDANTSSNLENFGLIKGAAVAVLGGAGQETVVNHGRIVGDVSLGDGNDTFVFGKGGNVAGDVFLGGGNNLFVVENGSGTSHIGDFTAADMIDVSAFFSSFSQLTAHSQQQGNNVVVALDHNDTLVLEHVQLSGLNSHEFIFA
jgi:hypothetical protein